MNEDMDQIKDEGPEHEAILRQLTNAIHMDLMLLTALTPVLDEALLRRLLNASVYMSERVKNLSEAANEQLYINRAIEGEPGGGA